jgi:hypothetical protein
VEQPAFTEELMEKMNGIIKVAEKGDRQITIFFKQGRLKKEFSGFYRGFDATQRAFRIYSPEQQYVRMIQLEQVTDMNFVEN